MIQGEWGLASRVNETPPLLRLFSRKRGESDSHSALHSFKLRLKRAAVLFWRDEKCSGEAFKAWGILRTA
jgi:hypothetical protein